MLHQVGQIVDVASGKSARPGDQIGLGLEGEHPRPLRMGPVGEKGQGADAAAVIEPRGRIVLDVGLGGLLALQEVGVACRPNRPRPHDRRRRAPPRLAPGPEPGPGAPASRDGGPNRCRRRADGLGAGPGGVLDRQIPDATSAIRIRTPSAAPPRCFPRNFPMTMPRQADAPTSEPAWSLRPLHRPGHRPDRPGAPAGGG